MATTFTVTGIQNLVVKSTIRVKAKPVMQITNGIAIDPGGLDISLKACYSFSFIDTKIILAFS